MPPKSVAAHITAVVSFAFAILAYVHPGFHPDATVEGFVVTVLVAVTGLLELAHVNLLKDWNTVYGDVLKLERILASQQPPVVVPPVVTPPVVVTTPPVVVPPVPAA